MDERKKDRSDREAHLFLLLATGVYDWEGRPYHLFWHCPTGAQGPSYILDDESFPAVTGLHPTLIPPDFITE